MIHEYQCLFILFLIFLFYKNSILDELYAKRNGPIFISILFNPFGRASDYDTTLHLTLFTLRHKDKCHTHSISHLKRRSCLYIPLSNRVRERMMISLLWCHIFRSALHEENMLIYFAKIFINKFLPNIIKIIDAKKFLLMLVILITKLSIY